jgi:hypothetical protein
MSLVEHFATLEDPRIKRKKLHCLIDIMVLSICAITSGTEGWQGIADVGHEKLEWLRRFVPLKKTVCLLMTVLHMCLLEFLQKASDLVL